MNPLKAVFYHYGHSSNDSKNPHPRNFLYRQWVQLPVRYILSHPHSIFFGKAAVAISIVNISNSIIFPPFRTGRKNQRSASRATPYSTRKKHRINNLMALSNADSQNITKLSYSRFDKTTFTRERCKQRRGFVFSRHFFTISLPNPSFFIV